MQVVKSLAEAQAALKEEVRAVKSLCDVRGLSRYQERRSDVEDGSIALSCYASPMRCPVLTWALLLPGARTVERERGELVEAIRTMTASLSRVSPLYNYTAKSSASNHSVVRLVPAIRCFYLISRRRHFCCAVSGTDLANLTICTRFIYAVSGPDLANHTTRRRARLGRHQERGAMEGGGGRRRRERRERRIG
eukprot:3160196-Rhodomonas_salina.3